VAVNIELANLSFAFGSREACLNDVSLEVNESELCCLLGPNGAGKTTLLRCLLGLLRPSAGSIRVAGNEVADLSPRQLACLVAYVPQTTTMVFPFTALEMVVMGRTPFVGVTSSPSRADRHIAAASLERLGIAHLGQRVFSQLSGGERQLTILARALAQEAPVMVLDEPTTGLDYGNEVRLLHVVSELVSGGATVLMTTHQPNHALTWADRAVLLRRGSVLASGPPAEILTGDQLSSLYEIPILVGNLPRHEGTQFEQLFCTPDLSASEFRPTHH
jgi:iron complex transport system ATP-binding protein